VPIIQVYRTSRARGHSLGVAGCGRIYRGRCRRIAFLSCGVCRELLLVRYVNRSLKVFRVNVEHKLLEEVKSLGGRTLYMLDFEGWCDMCVHTVSAGVVDGVVDFISREKYLDRPFSLVQILLRYCNIRFI
jgi:hypothetical protein